MKVVRTEDEFLIEASRRKLVITALNLITGLPTCYEAITPGPPPARLGGIWIMAGVVMDDELEEFLGTGSVKHEDYIGIFFDTPEDLHLITYMGGPEL